MKMQRLHLLAMEEERQSLMDALLRFGRLEIRQTEDLAADPDWARRRVCAGCAICVNWA